MHEDTPGFTPDLKRIEEGIDHIRPGAATALYDAIYLASRGLSRRQGRKVIVLITDGDDTISRVDYKEALRATEEAEAIVYSIIIVPIENSAGREIGGEHALIQLSEAPAASIITPTRSPNWTTPSARSATNCARSICWPIIRHSAPRFPNSVALKSK